MMQPTTTPTYDSATPRDGERGAALILALMVSLVLVFLGLGLLLQTSLGLQASGTDRWVTKALYAADAGAMMQIEMIQMGALASPSTTSFVLADDPDLAGLLKTEFTVNVSRFCTTEPDQPVEGYEAGDEEGYSRRFFHFRSEATRNVGDLAGLTRAVVEADVSSQPFKNDQFIPVDQCY
jgi:Tfp pilus assembly protein PilX